MQKLCTHTRSAPAPGVSAMTDPANATPSRLERELAREREQRHRNDDAKTDGLTDDDLRLKDARQSERSGNLQRHHGRLQK